jgi:hypothetical protein
MPKEWREHRLDSLQDRNALFLNDAQIFIQLNTKNQLFLLLSGSCTTIKYDDEKQSICSLPGT